jgi:predicted ester cyclase
MTNGGHAADRGGGDDTDDTNLPGDVAMIQCCATVAAQPVNTTSEEWAMSNITAVAKQFFKACEAGKGWDVCQAYCTPDASFSAQAEPLADVRTLRDYTDWMKGLLTFMPDGRYTLKSFANDEQRQNVSAYGVFQATHTGEGGPCPPTGKSTTTDYVYVMEFAGDKIRHMTKIWNAGWAIKELGWG